MTGHDDRSEMMPWVEGESTETEEAIENTTARLGEAGESFDSDFADRLFDAYEAIEPTAEAEDRMLANILAAQQAKETTDSSVPETTGPAFVEANVDTPVPAPLPVTPVRKHSSRRGTRIWLPVAATVLLGAVAVGVIMNAVSNSKNSQLAAPTEQAVTADTTAVEAEYAVGAASTDLEHAAETSMMAEDMGYAGEADIAEPSGAVPSNGYDTAESSTANRPAPPSDCARIELPDGTMLELAYDSGAPVALSQQDCGAEVGEAVAWNESGSDSISCVVYRRAGSPTEYVVNYGGSVYFLARRA